MSFTDATAKKPEGCPFCPVSPEVRVRFEDDGTPKYRVECENKDCHVQPVAGEYVSLAGALGAWNGRSYQVAPLCRGPVATELPDDAAFKAFPDLRGNQLMKDAPFKIVAEDEVFDRIVSLRMTAHAVCRGMYKFEADAILAVMNNYNALYTYAEKLTKVISK